MSHICISRDVSVPPAVVWDSLADLASHSEWMKDAASVRFAGETTRGIGTVMQVETRVGPLRTLDVLEVTGWEEGQSIEVDHRGLIKGSGRLAVEPERAGSRVTWEEDLTFPWWLGGPLAAWLAKPVLTRVWSENLRRLEESLSSL